MILVDHRRAAQITCLLLFTLFAAHCGSRATELRGSTMGTSYSIKLFNRTEIDNTQLQALIDKALKRVNGAMSTYDETSTISKFNALKSTGWYDIGFDFSSVLQAALVLARATDGYFDLTAGRLVNLWGFGPDGRPDKVPTTAQIRQALAATGHQKLVIDKTGRRIRKLNPGLYVDLSAIAKGYAVDMIAELLVAKGIINFMVEIGGEIRVSGLNNGEPWRIGVEKPAPGQRQLQRIVTLKDQAMATSGDYRNFYEKNGQRYSHTIDVRTGRPVTHKLAGVSVLHSSCMLADGYATALMAMGPERGLIWAEKNQIAALFLIYEGDHVVEKTSQTLKKQL